jgi:hypothetical protein
MTLVAFFLCLSAETTSIFILLGIGTTILPGKRDIVNYAETFIFKNISSELASQISQIQQNYFRSQKIVKFK